MIKYFEVAAGRAAGFVQYEESLKAWDHACGLICVTESGGIALDAAGDEVLFADRAFHVKGGIICSSKWATDGMRQALVAAAQRPSEVSAAAAVEVPSADVKDAAPPTGFVWGGVH